eukprot:TRINITY_DN26854_c0_g1_i1.p1 TRINITY_DN26854_c0_g1~~TRINITY_DN26854_c0_g1_i1.p1  ORF type:complete len:532 (+),score=125.47 TRINITY_DN26854_c0_g1_i1:88-1683(+)
MGIRSDVVDAKYVFEFEVGIWPLGTVQVLKDRETQALRSCKTVRKALLRDPAAAVARLRRLQKLQHPHINGIVDVVEDKSYVFIISSKTDGNDIMEWLERTLDDGNWIQETTCAFYLHQALTAIAHSHACHVHHRDLRPGSLLLTSKLPDASVKVTDCGLAGVLDPSGEALRKALPPFAAPELIEGDPEATGDAIDMWSVGAIAYTLLVGRAPPMAGAQPWARFSGASAEDSAAWAERSPESRDFVKQLMRLDPLERLSAPRALRHPWLRGVAVQSRNGSGGEHRMLCYMLSVLLLPEEMDCKTFQQLRKAFEAADDDKDGLVMVSVCQELLHQRGIPRAAAVAAVDIADALGSSALELCSFMVAAYMAQECGDRAQGPRDLAPRLLKRLISVYGDAGSGLVSLPQLRSRLCTATGREVEVRASVDFDEVLEGFQENAVLNSQMLIDELSSCEGRGTPLAADDCDGEAAGDDQDGFFGFRWGFGLENGLESLFSHFFQTCGRCASETGGSFHVGDGSKTPRSLRNPGRRRA